MLGEKVAYGWNTNETLTTLILPISPIFIENNDLQFPIKNAKSSIGALSKPTNAKLNDSSTKLL
jgi:hypothetical protein